jgi:ferrous iron transport protein B
MSLDDMTDAKNKRRLAFTLPFLTCGSKMPAITLLLTSVLDLGFLGVYAFYFAPAILGFVIYKIMKRRHKSEIQCANIADGFCKPRFWELFKTTGCSVWLFVRRISFGIAVAIMALYFLSNYTIWLQATESIEQSALVTICGFLAPLFTPLGFGSAALVAALLSGIAGKEMIAVTLAMLGGVGLLGTISTAGILSFVVFILLYPPCAPCLLAITRQVDKKTTWQVAGLNLALAYVCAFVFYMVCMIPLWVV